MNVASTKWWSAIWTPTTAGAEVLRQLPSCLLLLFWLQLSSHVPAQQADPQPATDAVRIALVTFGPGEEIWALFAHNAIRVQSTDVDLLYNFGYFDLHEPGFYWRYARGIMRYFAVPEDTAAAYDHYARSGRSVREQQLDLAPQQAALLAHELQRLVAPDQRVYDYDYFYNNCSTRVRDLLDQALNGRLRAALEPVPAATTLRREALRMVQGNVLVYLGLQLALGRPVDVRINQWQAAFLPDNLATQLAVFDQQLLRSDVMIAQGPQAATNLQPKYLLFAVFGLLTVLTILLPAILSSDFAARLGVRLWLLLSSLAGMVLLLLWCCSLHASTHYNENLLLLLPSNLLLWRFRGRRIEKLAAWLMALAMIAAVALKVLPQAQFNHDLMLWLLPAQLAVLYFWLISMREQRVRVLW